MAPGGEKIDGDTAAFLALQDFELAAWTTSRAADKGLPLPSAALPGVIENVALLQAQTTLFVTALGEAAGQPPETFQP